MQRSIIDVPPEPKTIDSKMRTGFGGRGGVRQRLRACAPWALWSADPFPPDAPLCHSNVRSSWVTSPPPALPHPSLSLFASVFFFFAPSERRRRRSPPHGRHRGTFAPSFSRRWGPLDTQERISISAFMLTGWKGEWVLA